MTTTDIAKYNAKLEQRIKDAHTERFDCTIWIEYDADIIAPNNKPALMPSRGCPRHNIAWAR